jgi:alcohol dehydrogenase class IV
MPVVGSLLPDAPPRWPPLSGYQLTLPHRVRFGWGVRGELPKIARELGDRAWLVVGSRTLERSGVIAEIETELRHAGLVVERLATISREPLVTDVDAAVATLRRASGAPRDVVVAVGGGSAIDLGKAAAALATNPRGSTVQDFLEGVGGGLSIERPPLPLIAVPTTAGTGSEATLNAVLSSLDPPFKKSLRSPLMVSAAVILDPELTVSCPPHVTAHSGLDAITQLIESFVSRRTNAWTAALCREGLARALPSLPAAVECGADREARTAMLHAAFLSGMALANSGLGLAHGVAAALGVRHNIPHGLACAVMLPAAMRFNRSVCQAALAEVGRLCSPALAGVSDDEAADGAIDYIESLCRRVGIPRTLQELGLGRDDLEPLIPASRGNSLSGNPRDVTDDDLRTLLTGMLTA